MNDTLNKTYEDWYNVIASYDKAFREWEARVPRIIKRYRDDSRTRNNPNARFNILWSNVQVIKPAIFARLPRPDVSRRFLDNEDRKSTRLNSSHVSESRMPSSA